MFRRVNGSARLPEAVSTLLVALGDPQRQRVLRTFLDAGSWELAATDIAGRCAPLSRPAVSHHLGLMRRAGVLRSRRAGKYIYYAINRAYIEEALRAYLAFLDVCCVAAEPCGGSGGEAAT
jgi:DNA-binding transcriptional ArsR family regulator